MKLPELSADASPEFTDAATCKEWLEHVPEKGLRFLREIFASGLDRFHERQGVPLDIVVSGVIAARD